MRCWMELAGRNGFVLLVLLGFACGGNSGENLAPKDAAADHQGDAGGDLVSNDLPCVPSCAGKECGGDGCGGSCGLCCGDVLCVAGKCDCVLDCAGKECGGDGCGGFCSAAGPLDCQAALPDDSDQGCAPGLLCDPATFGCLDCLPDCEGRQCGDDGCGGSCGDCPCSGPDCCAGALECGPEGHCVVPPLDDCAAVAACVGAEPVEACTKRCEVAAEASSWTDYWDLADCYNECGAQEWPPDPDGCGATCFDLQVECYQGDDSCAEILACMGGCGEGDVTCYAKCPTEGTAAAQGLWADLVLCLVEACPSDAAADCPEVALGGACLDALTACQE